MIKCIRLAFIEKDTDHMARLYNAWLSTFICRLWSAAIDKMSINDLYSLDEKLPDYKATEDRQQSKRRFFITNPSFFVSFIFRFFKS